MYFVYLIFSIHFIFSSYPSILYFPLLILFSPIYHNCLLCPLHPTSPLIHILIIFLIFQFIFSLVLFLFLSLYSVLYSLSLNFPRLPILSYPPSFFPMSKYHSWLHKCNWRLLLILNGRPLPCFLICKNCTK